MDIIAAYRIVHRQAFIPILVDDGRDVWMEVEACLLAGLKVIEYTQRRADIAGCLPELRRRYPELVILVGSILDAEKVVRGRRQRFPQLATMEEYAALGVDGFVSMAGFRTATIRRFAGERLLLPGVATPTEALRAIEDGAHFVKVVTDPVLAAQVVSAPLFGFAPVAVTGGMTMARIETAMQEGAMLAMTGFDVLLREEPNPTPESAAAILDCYRRGAVDARLRRWPQLQLLEDNDDLELWRRTVPHFWPFGGER